MHSPGSNSLGNGLVVTTFCATSASATTQQHLVSSPEATLHHHHHLPHLTHFQQQREQQQQLTLQQHLPGAYPYRNSRFGAHASREATVVTRLAHLPGVWDTNKIYSTMTQYNSNPVGALQERFQSRGITPQYRVVQAEGASHCPTFSYQVFVGDFVAMGSGSSKKQAKHNAARAMLDKLDGRLPAQDGLQPLPAVLHSTPCAAVSVDSASSGDTNGTNGGATVGNTIGQLQELCVHKGLPMPIYDLAATEGQPHQRCFTMKVRVGALTSTGEGTSKKDAKRDAAARMIGKVQMEKLEDVETAVPVEVKLMVKKEEDEGERKQEQVDDLAKKVADLKIEPLTPGHSKKIQDFYHQLQDHPGNKLSQLHRTPLKTARSGDFVALLADVALEQKFEVTYVEVEEKSEEDECQYIVQISSLPVAVCYGTGSSALEAKQDAAKHALNYLKLMTKKSVQANGK